MKTYKQQIHRFTKVEYLISLTFKIFLVINFKAASGLPTSKTSDAAESHLYRYLSEPLSSAILAGTEIDGLEANGILDDGTLKTISLPKRCSISDKIEVGPHSRSKRYTLRFSKWGHKNLTYKISKYPQRLTEADTDTEIFRAFSVWSQYTDLTFTQQNEGKVDIDIRFVEGDHNDGNKFDGPGGVLGHAFFPEDGRAHFDDSEFWTFNTTLGVNLFQVAIHIFGHSLGLDHSDVKSSIMAPFHLGYTPDFHLDTDDISAIQALYGKKSSDGSLLPTLKPNRRPYTFEYRYI